MTFAAIFAAFLCVISPWTVPIGALPVSLATFAVYLAGLTLGRNGVWAVVCYVLLGCVGLPVFAGFSGGAGVFAGPTGGFLTGYVPGVLVCGLICDIIRGSSASRAVRLAGDIASALSCAVIIYTFGILWYINLTGAGISAAFGVCVIPFVVPEILKISAAVMLSGLLRRRLNFLTAEK